MHSSQALLFSSLLAISVMARNFSEPAANPVCRQRPKKLIKTAKSCCTIPEPYFEDFTEDCTILGDSNATIFCQLECLFNVSKALSGPNLNLENLHKLLDDVFPDAVDFIGAYYISYEECMPLVKKALKEREGIKHKCNPAATLYAACAQMKLLKYCPTKAWNSTEFCEDMKGYVIKCANKLLPYRRRSRSGSIRLEAMNFDGEMDNFDNATLKPNTNESTETTRVEFSGKTNLKN